MSLQPLCWLEAQGATSAPRHKPRFLGMPVRSNHCQIRFECVSTHRRALDSKFIEYDNISVSFKKAYQ